MVMNHHNPKRGFPHPHRLITQYRGGMPVSGLLHRENLVRAMITGRKRA